MPSGYLVTLGDGSLDAGDVISGSLVTFTTDQTIGSGQWTWTGTYNGTPYTDELEPGTYYLATDGNVYFEPSLGPVTTLTDSTVVSAPSFSLPTDGIVNGTGDAEVIDGSYTDSEGESVSSGADSIAAGGGDDTITAQGGNDTIEAGAGNDVVSGNGGADLIYGDSQSASTGSSETLSWTAQGSNGDSIASGLTVTTGEMQVTASFTDTGNNNPRIEIDTNDTGYVGSGEPFDADSLVYLRGDGDGDTLRANFSFAAVAGSEMQDEVENLTFRINDIDWGDNNHTDIVTVTALNAAGDPVTVTFTLGGGDTLVGNTITADEVGENPQDLGGSVLITIAGPVSSFEIEYSNGQNGAQAVWLSDLHFDTLPQEPGDDSISGGGGADTI